MRQKQEEKKQKGDDMKVTESDNFFYVSRIRRKIRSVPQTVCTRYIRRKYNRFLKLIYKSLKPFTFKINFQLTKTRGKSVK